MKRRIMLEFCCRGAAASGLGPLILAVVYLIMERQGIGMALTVREVCLGIFSLSALAFVAGGMNVLYQIERLPLMAAIAIHGVVLYGCYLATYLVNGWLEQGMASILVFTGIFVAGYLIIWAVIYAIIRRSTARVNRALRQKQTRGQP